MSKSQTRMCEPTPTSTIYSTSTLTTTTEYATSSRVSVSGTVSIKTITTSSCASTAQPVDPSPSSQAVSSVFSSQQVVPVEASTSRSAGSASSGTTVSQPLAALSGFTPAVESTSTSSPSYDYPASQDQPSSNVSTEPSSTTTDLVLVAVPTSAYPIVAAVEGSINTETARTPSGDSGTSTDAAPSYQAPEATVFYDASPSYHAPEATVSYSPANAIASPAYSPPPPAHSHQHPAYSPEPPAETPPAETDVTTAADTAVTTAAAEPAYTPPAAGTDEQGGSPTNHGWHGHRKRQHHHRFTLDPTVIVSDVIPAAEASYCASWTVITSFETVTGRPTITWSNWTVTTTSDIVTQVPVSTLHAPCTSTTIDVAQTTTTQWDGWGAGQSSSTTEDSDSVDTWALQAGWRPSSSAAVTSSTDANAGAMVGDTSTSTDPFPSSTGDTSLSVSSTSSLTSLASSGRATWLYTIIQNTFTRLPTPTYSPSTSVAPQDHPAKEGNTSSKAISAGAAVAGIVGLLLAIAGTLAVVRWYLQRKRTKRARMMRSSWFYGGDVREEERDDEDEKEVRTEKHHSSVPMSRFSSASITPRQSRTSTYPQRVAVPSTPPVPPTPVRTPGDALSGAHQAMRTVSPNLPPVPQIPSKFERATRPPPPESVVPASAAMASSRWTAVPPRPGVVERPTLNWGDSYASRFIPQTAGPSEPSRSSHDRPEVIASAALPSSVGHRQEPGWHQPSLPSTSAARSSSNGLSSSAALHSTGNSGETTRGHSHYSNSGTVHSIYSQPEDFCLADLPEERRRAITAPGRTSIEVQTLDVGSYRGSISFPEPRTKYTASTGPPTSFPHLATGRTLTVVSQTPSSAASEMRRTMEPTPRLSVPKGGRDDSVFEFASMTGGSEGRRTQYTTHTGSRADTDITGNWYDESLWDESVPGTAGKSSMGTPSSGLDKGKGKERDNRKNRGKSVRWGDEEEPLLRGPLS